MKYFFFFIMMALPFLSCQHETKNAGLWPGVKQETRPWTRWWWMGNAVDQENISRLMKTYADAGFGGVEITPIYGAVGYEEKYIRFLSPEWMKMLGVTVENAGKYGMGVDMNTGTGWPFGGPQINVSNAASRLIVQSWKISSDKPFSDKIVVNDLRQAEAGATLQLLISKDGKGKITDITDKVDKDGKLNWVPENGTCDLTAAFCGKTFQRVKRAAPGGEGLVMDHFSKNAVDVYLSRFDSAFSKSNHGIRCFFNDSYEAAGTDWTPGMLKSFEKLRGYKLQPWLNELTNRNDSSETAHRIRYDYRQTISDLLLGNFTRNWTTWANKKRSLTRNQAHGSPGNLLDLYAAVDIPECETFGSSYFPIPGLRRDSADIRNVDPDPVMMKFASSAANVSGKHLISCETFTWLAEHFKVSLSQCKPEVEQVFLSGVNHVFYHGTSYSPESANWPGWLFYASVNFAPSNSFWTHLPGLNHFITKCQSVLQSGLPDNELLVYWPLSDYWMTTGNSQLQLAIHDIDRWLRPTAFYKMVTNLKAEGYSVDFTSDKMLENLEINDGKLVTSAGSGYKTLIFPAVKYLPENTFQLAVKMAEKGAIVIFENLPGDVPGYGNLSEHREQLKDMISALKLTETSPGILTAHTEKGEVYVTGKITELLKSKGILPETLVKSGLQFIRRKTGEGIYYFLVNHTAGAIDDYMALNETRCNNYMLDPLSDATGKADQKTGNGVPHVRVQLRPGESIFLFSTNLEIPASNWRYADNQQKLTEIKGPWKIRFTKGGPVLPEDRELNELKPWTSDGDSDAINFSGSAVYSASFNLNGKPASDYLLDLGKVCESARVRINGGDAGIVWSIPFTIRIGKFLKPGQNTIEIEVANLMANRIRWMDQQKMEWRRYHEINFVNINYLPFDASAWLPLPSGLAGPVTLQPVP